MLDSVEEVERRLAECGYIADRMLATTVFLAGSLKKPIFLEGEPGVGKTTLAKIMASVLGADLIRLQCYEGLDSRSALYEWNYLRQMLEIRLHEARGVDKQQIGRNIFSEEFLLKRPLLQAIQHDSGKSPILLIDEIDRSDEEFEAFLLEILSDFQITIPEIGTLRAERIPFVVLTSNRTRELHDALKRRCLYHWIDYPSLEKEQAIISVTVKGIQEKLSAQICRFMELMREKDFYKQPGVAETIDWASALLALGVEELEPNVIRETLCCILKSKSDQERLSNEELREAVAVTKAVKGGRALGGPNASF